MNTNHIIAKVSEIFFFSYLFTYFGNFYVWGFKLDFYDESSSMFPGKTKLF